MRCQGLQQTITLSGCLPWLIVRIRVEGWRIEVPAATAVARTYALLETAVGRGRLILQVQRAGQVAFDVHVLPQALPIELHDLGLDMGVWESNDDLFLFSWETEPGLPLNCCLVAKPSPH